MASDTLYELFEEVEKLDNAEQQDLLRSLRLKKYREGKIKISNPPKGLKPLTMKEIDVIKHKVRKLYADK